MDEAPHNPAVKIALAAEMAERPFAVAIRHLSVLAYANGFTLWHYKASGRLLHDVEVPGFFDDARDMLATGDMLLVSARDGGRLYVASAPTDGAVTIARGA